MQGASPRITSFLIKIASRCNLACDYCYVYEHADQSWRNQPRVMSTATRQHLAQRLGEYAESAGLREMVVVFHGGEPLLAGAESIVATATAIRRAVPATTKIEFCLQTNGTLLDDVALDAIEAAGIGVSLSLDGPARANDLHRLDHAGRSSFAAAALGLERLANRTSIYSGLIAVIETRVPAEEVFSFVAPHRPPRFDFLLPDANHERPPPGRSSDDDVYVRWLVDAFDVWFDRYAHIPVRLFEAILDGLAGLPSGTDALGLGDVTLLTIETDGSFHDLDVLKITRNGATALEKHVERDRVADVAAAPAIAAHRALLQLDGLSEKCQQCSIVNLCGGGAVPHRYSADGFANPTIYCREMLALVAHARKRLTEALEAERSTNRSAPGDVPEIDLAAWSRPETGGSSIVSLLASWAEDADSILLAVLDEIKLRQPTLQELVEEIAHGPAERRRRLAIEPSTVLWTDVMRQAHRGASMRGLDGEIIAPDTAHLYELAKALAGPAPTYPRIHRNDPWLRRPFTGKIIFEDGELVIEGIRLVEQALATLARLQPALLEEIRLLASDIQFVRDPGAHPDKAVSFSDNCVPGALYLSIRAPGGVIDPLVFTESLIHEHRHQKLYLLQRVVSLVDNDSILLESPWREDPRPPSGLLHAVFVFVQLYDYWRNLASQSVDVKVTDRCVAESAAIARRLQSGFETLSTAPLALRGRELAGLLERQFRSIEPTRRGGER